MPKLTKIYTRKGDAGETSLGSRERVPKDALRVQAYGTVDELNSMIGLALAQGVCARLTAVLPAIQNQLFNLGADLAFVGAAASAPQIEARHVTALEQLMDEMTAVIGPLKNFILPGGSIGAAQLHVARTICRRAERIVVTLAREEQVNPEIVKYLNRLSDALFVMARYENHQRGVPEPLWDTRA